jgi:hypothetical protein
VKLVDISGTKRGNIWKVKLMKKQTIRTTILETCVGTSMKLRRVMNLELT